MPGPRYLLTILSLVLGLFALPAAAFSQSLLMATTTSTDNTGLLDYLAPEFKKDTGIELKWTAVGTGKALELGKNCDVDVLLVHAPPAEKRFAKKGYGTNRTQIMYNDFVIIGPAEDPASVQEKPLFIALRTIAKKKATFISRGDHSGTHKKELLLWKKAGLQVPAKANWYLETGQGMMSTIRVAAERSGYTLADRGTYIKYADKYQGSPPLKVLVQGEKVLFNQYSVMAVNPEHCPNVEYEGAKRLIQWLTSQKAQEAIGRYRLLGQQLFTPNAD